MRARSPAVSVTSPLRGGRDLRTEGEPNLGRGWNLLRLLPPPEIFRSRGSRPISTSPRGGGYERRAQEVASSSGRFAPSHYLDRIVAGAENLPARGRGKPSARLRPRLADSVDRQDFVSRGIAQHIEPATAAGLVIPAFRVRALGIGAQEDVIRPVGIAHG